VIDTKYLTPKQVNFHKLTTRYLVDVYRYTIWLRNVSRALNVITSLIAELEDNPELLEKIKKRI